MENILKQILIYMVYVKQQEMREEWQLLLTNPLLIEHTGGFKDLSKHYIGYLWLGNYKPLG